MADDVLNIIRFPNCSKETIEEIKKAVERPAIIDLLRKIR